MPQTAVSDALNDLATRFSGELLQPLDAGYEDARRVHNGLIDKRPFLIARCRNAADVADAVRLAREYNLEVAIKGGGHNAAGRATIDGGVMIDLSLMKGIYVDSEAHTARVQGGGTWREYNRETQLHGLASTGGVISTTGVGGLTLGGGLGWLQSKYGLAIDNLRSAQLVLADGRVVTASANENADLFWAVRGAGANFGVATSLEFDVHHVGPTITGGLLLHPGRRRERRSRGAGIRSELHAAPAVESEVRSDEFLPHESEHPAGVNHVRNATRCICVLCGSKWRPE